MSREGAFKSMLSPTPAPVFLHAHGPNFSSVGWIKELCLNGVVYEYCITEGANETDMVEVDIFRHELDFSITGIPCSVVNEQMVDAPRYSSVATKQCELRFEKLTESQRSELQKFLGSSLSR
jgi:hypothetical protein